MNYIAISVQATEADDQRDILIAALSELQAEGFEETELAFTAFFPEEQYPETEVQALLQQYTYSFSTERVQQQNWNAQWEADFEPVILGQFCTVRAHFHDMPLQTTHDIIITPKMSFGTGHHDTTRLMIQAMEHISFAGKTVLDFGTGTGVLAILADKLGAAGILALDNDEWSYNNALENIGLNHCPAIDVQLGELDAYSDRSFDIILANINRHILLQYMPLMYRLLPAGGLLLMSGLLREDEAIVSAAAREQGFHILDVMTGGNWIAIKARR